MARTGLTSSRGTLTEERAKVESDIFSLLCRVGVPSVGSRVDTNLISTGVCSFAGWVNWVENPGASTNWAAMFCNRTAVAQNFTFYLQNNVAPRNAISLIVNTTAGGTQVKFQGALKTLTHGWNHIAWTRNGTALKLYVNGVNIVSETCTGTDFANASLGDFTIGGFSSLGNETMYGNFKDFRWFKDTELTPTQVMQIYKRENPVNPTGWWKMDEGTGTSLADSSGNSYTMTTTGFVWTVDSPFYPRFSMSDSPYVIETDGTNDYITYGNIADFAFGTAFSYGLWVNPIAFDDSFMSVYDNLSANGGFIFRYHNDGTINLYSRRADGTLDVLSSGVKLINTNRLQHLAFTVSASGTTKIYVNGKLVASGSVPSFGTPNTGYVYCGYSVGNGTMQRATYTDMWIYQSELSATQIYDIVWNKTYPLTPYARWKCTDGTGTTITDSSGNGRNATLVNGAIWANNPMGGSRTLAS